jgi:hypothetical protein
VPLSHPPEHAQLDFGEAIGVIGGVRQKIHFYCMDLPQSHAPFVKAYSARVSAALNLAVGNSLLLLAQDPAFLELALRGA